MGMTRKYRRPSKAAYGSKRWPALRQQALRRDDFQCVKCGARGRLEVDHIEPVRTHPELMFDLTNLQTLCPTCHAYKTRGEIGLGEITPARQEWRRLLKTEMENKENA